MAHRLSLPANSRVAQPRLMAFSCNEYCAEPPIWRVHAAGLGRYRGRACVYRAAVPDRKLRRPRAWSWSRGPRAAFDLSVVAGDLLHIVDVFRLGRLCIA